MKTTTFQIILNLACERAQRTRDKIPPQEMVSLQGYLADEFETLWPSQNWPELIPVFQPIQNIQNNQFSRNEGEDNEIGDILTILDRDPHCSDRYRPIPYDVGDNVVYLLEPRECVWIEYLLPYPSTIWPDLTTMTLAAFLAAVCPRRFQSVLAYKAAAHLLNSDNNPAGAGVQLGLANAALAAQVQRLADVPIPAWRGLKAESGGPHRRFVSLASPWR